MTLGFACWQFKQSLAVNLKKQQQFLINSASLINDSNLKRRVNSQSANTNSNSSSVNIHESNLITNADTTIDYNTKPFFASKLTNSQLSEELSNEIGL